MHVTSRLKMVAFLDTYAADARGKTVLDVGSRVANKGKYSYRNATDAKGMVYTGLDMEAGENVDIVPANPSLWSEIADEQFDYVISGQAFEHAPFPWITFAEVARVLKPGGRTFLIAPSSGHVHRFPYDCWRYYPDSWASLCALTGLVLTESIREGLETEDVPGSQWIDSAAVITKEPFASPETRADFYQNLKEIVAPFATRQYNVQPAILNEGACYRSYLALAKSHAVRGPKEVKDWRVNEARRANERLRRTTA